ncbi:hypothetical protein KQ305_11180 [Synechococcus sp. CS-1332]|nr:hypothetical protein [Synechococcus sp. CS-1332]
MKQTLLWTCLPNGISDAGLRVSVLVTPRLDADLAPPTLASFSDWSDWPAALAQLTFVFYADGQPVAKTSVLDAANVSRLDNSLGAPNSADWQALLRSNSVVERYAANTDLQESEVLAYSATDVHDRIKDLYVDLARRCSDALPRIGRDLLDDPLWQTFIDAVEQVDRWGTKTQREDILPFERERDTQIENRLAGVNPLMAGSRAGSSAFSRDQIIRHLARFELFHTPPLQPKPLESRDRQDDRRISSVTQEFERPPVPTAKELARTMHFHRVVAAMNAYPTLQRRLGLVTDFVLDRRAFPINADFRLHVEVDDSVGVLVGRQRDISPRTQVTLTERDFFARSRVLPPPNDTEIRLDRGLLDLYSQPDRYAVLQADVDGAGLKLMNFARTLAGYRSQKKGDSLLLQDDVSRQEKRAGAPALRTAGLMLVRKDRAQTLKGRLAAGKQLQMDADGPGFAELWAEDLVRGYRIDVWDQQTGIWRSLCERTATYTLAGEQPVAPKAGKEEATVQLAATRSPDPAYNQKLLYLHETLITWTGWSLAAPAPGLAIGVDVGTPAGGKPAFTEQAGELPGLEFRSLFNAVPGSLPRLRYGRSYALRARAVDLAGQSLLPQENNIGPERPVDEARPFLRFEPVAAPALALFRPAQGSTERPAEGESMARLAIRSFNDVFDDPAPSGELARRHAVPPQSTVREAELHGVLDQGGLVDAATFQMLAVEMDRDASDPAAALVEETFALKGALDTTAVDTTFSVWREGASLSYLPDPMAFRVSAWFLGHPTIPPETTIRIPLYPPGTRWPQAQTFRIELVDVGADALAQPAFDATTRVLRIPLAKGERATLRLAMAPRKRDLFERMGLWQWLDPATQQQIEETAIDGRCWLFSPWQDIDLVHAVQRPLIRPIILRLEVSRSTGETRVLPRILTTCSLKSTDRLDLLAQWHEPQDDPASPAPLDLLRDDLAFQVKVTDSEDYVPRSQPPPDHSLPADEHKGPDVIGLNANVDLFASKHHEFNDTRYRRIEYRLKATSRFREYLPPRLLLEPDPALAPDGPFQQVEQNLLVEGPTSVTWIPSSAPPPPPQILYVVPTFGWVRGRDGDGTIRSWRRGGGLRIYLDRPWNVSGYGEMLAVVLPPAEFRADPESQPTEKPYTKFVTQWGNDPIWQSPFVAGAAPDRRRFPLARWQPDPAGGWLPNGAPTSEADQSPGPFPVGDRSVAELRLTNDGLPVEIAPHDVAFDPERQLWFCDIEMDQGSSYWPFVRLALARYQPCSTTGAHLSEVEFADFMQLTADRWLTVRPEQEGRVRFVTVYGPGFTDSGGAQVARSEIDPLSRTATSYAAVTKTSVINVWLELLEPALGEDFGWERVSGADGTALPAGTAAPGLEPQVRMRERLTPEQGLRALALKRDGDFANLLIEGLAERIVLRPPLWDGRLDIPEGLDGRLRLVVAEYEEYPVDGPPKQDGVKQVLSGRRLVFVEHVPLTE